MLRPVPTDCCSILSCFTTIHAKTPPPRSVMRSPRPGWGPRGRREHAEDTGVVGRGRGLPEPQQRLHLAVALQRCHAPVKPCPTSLLGTRDRGRDGAPALTVHAVLRPACVGGAPVIRVQRMLHCWGCVCRSMGCLQFLDLDSAGDIEGPF